MLRGDIFRGVAPWLFIHEESKDGLLTKHFLQYLTSVRQQLVIALLSLFLLLNGCGSSRTVGEEDSASSERVNPERFHELLDRLNAGPGAGITAGTVPYASATNYIVSRFQAARLQPGLRSGFDATFRSTINTIKGVSLTVAGRDSLRFVAGIDYVADGHTGVNTTEFDHFVAGPPGQIREGMAEVAVLPVEEGSFLNLRLLNNRGLSAVLLVGPLRHKVQPAAVDSMSVIRVTHRGFGRLMNVSPAGVSSILNANTPRVFALPTSVQLETEAVHQSDALRSNLIAILPGRFPSTSSELVVVAAQLDSGNPGGVGHFDFTDMGIGAAVVVDAAVNLPEKIAFASKPTPSFMFVLFGGSPRNLEGFNSFLANSIWSRDKIVQILLVGFDENLGDRLEAEGRKHGVEVELIPVSVPSNFRRSGFVTRPADIARAGGRAEETVRFENRERRAAITAAGLEAQRLSDIVMARAQEHIDQAPPADKR